MAAVKYKFYVSKKTIPWMLGGENIKPHWNIQDGYFAFTEVVGKQFNFKNVFQATIVADSDKYTYWKVEKFVDNVLEKTYYFYTAHVVSIIRNGYILALQMDTYLTYTRDVIKALNNYSYIPLKRGSISWDMLGWDDGWPLGGVNRTAPIRKALKNLDDGILTGDDGYTTEKKFPLLEYKFNANGSEFPINVARESVWGNTYDVFSTYMNLLHKRVGVDYDYKVNIIDVRNNKTLKSCRFKTNIFKPTPLKGEEKNYADCKKLVNDDRSIEFIAKSNNEDVWNEANLNMFNGYFAVFRHQLGFLDAYPILGKVKMNCRVAYGDSPGTVGVSESNIYINGPPIIANLDNDWDSMYREYIEKKTSDGKDQKHPLYTGDAFLGFYKWVFPVGKVSRLHFAIQEYFEYADTQYPAANIYEVQLTVGGVVKPVKCHMPKRVFYRLKPNDILGMELCDAIEQGSGNFKTKHFVLATSGTNRNFINEYIKLLEPICFGANQMVPARYSHLYKKVENTFDYGFTIPVGFGFTDGFKMFLRTNIYNNPTLSLSFGGRLAGTNSKYFDQLAQIEQQKNAGIASSVGNLFAQPLNWLSAGINSGLFVQGAKSLSKTEANNAAFPAFKTSGNYRKTPIYNTKTITDTLNEFTDSFASNMGASGGLNIGGLGNFIGDSVRIGTTINQANLAKRNVGPGYLSTTEDDLLNAVAHNSFISTLDTTADSILDFGWYTYASKWTFDNQTQEKYRYFYNMWGFPIFDFVHKQYWIDINDYVEEGNIGYFELDRDWCLTNLTELANYNDNLVRGAILDDLESIRVKVYN